MDTEDRRWTRAQLLRRAAGTGALLAVGGRLGAGRALFAPDASADAAGPTTRHFASRPDLVPPAVQVLHHEAGQTGDGFLFLAPSSGPGHRGNLIVDDAGEPIWFHPTTPVTAMNFRAAVYRGKPVLTWWEGRTEHGLGDGTHVILDTSYRVVARVPSGAGRPSDLHEFVLTSRGTALVTAWERRNADLSAFGGASNGVVVGGVVQELALPSGRVLFEWRSLDHVDLAESHATPGHDFFDYFHVNSIDLDSDGNLLVSARNTWAVYKISRHTGEVIWRLGGKKSDFAMGPGTGFAWQHDARHHHGDDLVSLFDDGAAPAVQPQSKGLVLALDRKRMRATVHRKYTHRPSVLAHALGSIQLLPNGNALVGWGTAPYFTEYSDGGRVLLDAKLPHGGQNYRTLRMPWTGHPHLRPEVTARSIAGGHLLHASWNGSTELASWQLETGARAGGLSIDRTVPKAGFETAVSVPASIRFAAMAALDRHGKVLGRSKTLKL